MDFKIKETHTDEPIEEEVSGTSQRTNFTQWL